MRLDDEAVLRTRTLRLNWAIAVLLPLYLVSQATIVHIVEPIGASSFFRFQLATQRDVALEVLHGWGEAGRAVFMTHFRLDFIHPFIYGALLFVALKRFCSDFLGSGPARLVYVLPWLAALLDCVENLLEIATVHQLDTASQALVFASGSVAITKWSLAGLSLLIVCAGLVQHGARRLARL